MRTIKFRQAIILNDKFSSWHYWGFVDDNLFVRPYISDDNSVSEALKQSYQFTGLLDKNGKEIWEGDITLFEWSAHKAHWKDSKYEIVRHKIIFEDGYYLMSPFNSEIETWDILIHPYVNKIKVIGNIYENESLIK